MKKKKVFDFPELSVDSANIGIADLSYIQRQGGDQSAYQGFIEVEKGKTYEVKLTVYGTYEGDMTRTALITMKSDMLVVGDIAYSFVGAYDKLGDLIRRTDGFKKIPARRGFCLITNADGGFRVRVELKETPGTEDHDKPTRDSEVFPRDLK